MSGFSRFSVLAVDDSSGESDGATKKTKPGSAKSSKKGKEQAQASDSKKKPKKKKKKSTAASAELTQQDQVRQEELDKLQYEKDLQDAILASKIASEKAKEIATATGSTAAVSVDVDSSKKKGKKKKNKVHSVMSIDEFNHLKIAPKARGSDSDSDEDIEPPPPTLLTHVPEEMADSNFFNNISQESSKIIFKEKVHEDFKQQYKSGHAVASLMERKLGEKDEEMDGLRDQISRLQTELAEEKERTSTLQATMASLSNRKAVDLLHQVRQLSTVKDELSAELSESLTSLEQERTSNHQLRAELDRLKAKR